MLYEVITSFLMLIGGASRLIYAQAESEVFPKIFKYRSKTNAPISGISLLLLTNFLTLFAVYLKIVSLTDIIAAVNAFLIINIVMAAISSLKVFEKTVEKGFSIILSISFIAMFLFSSKIVMAIIFIMFFATITPNLKRNNSKLKIN